LFPVDREKPTEQQDNLNSGVSQIDIGNDVVVCVVHVNRDKCNVGSSTQYEQGSFIESDKGRGSYVMLTGTSSAPTVLTSQISVLGPVTHIKLSM
jgi:hypothetical protein